MKKLAVLLTITLMVMLAEADGLSFAIETELGGIAESSVEHPELSSGSFMVEPLGGGSLFSIEKPDTAAGSSMIEDFDGGGGAFSIELFDSALAMDLLYAKYFCLVH